MTNCKYIISGVEGSVMMLENEAICYNKNFINQVIVRVDFLKLISNEVISSAPFVQSIIEYFPRRGKEQILRFNTVGLAITPEKMKISADNPQTVDGRQIEYTSESGKNKVVVSNQYIIFTIKEYHSFEKHFKCIKDIVGRLFEEETTIASRTGIRFINMYEPQKITIRKKYFSSDVAAAIMSSKHLKDEPNMLRSMHFNEYRFDNMILNFRFGMFNPDYPETIKTNAFVLDFDCFTNSNIDNTPEIVQCILDGHTHIQELFERKITDLMREEMQK